MNDRETRDNESVALPAGHPAPFPAVGCPRISPLGPSFEWTPSGRFAVNAFRSAEIADLPMAADAGGTPA